MSKFEDFNNIDSEIDTLRSEHLKEGIDPIWVCLRDEDRFESYGEPEKEALAKEGAYGINISESPTELEKKGFKNGGIDSYVISPLDGLNKFSGNFRNCTGLVVSGQDRDTGENVSFLTHQSPRFIFLNQKRQDLFLSDLKSSLLEIKEKCEEGSIDALLFGGNYVDDQAINNHISTTQINKNRYLNSIKLISEVVDQELGFQPAVATGPKRTPGEDRVVFDNQKKRLYISRPEVGESSSNSYLPQDIEEQRKTWDE